MMRDYNNEICGTCKWHKPDEVFPSDWVCVNADSENCADYTEYEDTCDHWEEREERSKND